MSERLLSSLDRFPPFAIYCAEERVFAGPGFFEKIAECELLPAIVKSRERLTLCPPWAILANRFHIKGNEYTLLSFIRETEQGMPTLADAELAALSLTDTLRDVLACTDTRFVLPETFSPVLLFQALTEGVLDGICDRVSTDAPFGVREGMTEIALRNLTYAIGILLSAYYGAEDTDTLPSASLRLTSQGGRYLITLKIPNWNESPFLADLIDALVAPSGFTLVREGNCYLFSMPAIYAPTLSLRTHPENEIAVLLSLVRRLFTDLPSDAAGAR